MTPEQSRLHEEYENANEPVKKTVDLAFQAAFQKIKECEMEGATDDRAEELVVALYKYLMDSVD